MNTLYQDDTLFVINKPPGMLSQADATGDDDVVTVGKRRLGEGEAEPFLGLVHRLDRPASGVMVLARTSEAAKALSQGFRERSVEKRYLAVVEGTLSGVGRWTDTIAKLGREPQIVAPDHLEGKPAEASWQALGTAAASETVSGAGPRTLLQVQLHTGRPHQIRLHAASRHHPIVGDVRHGGSPAFDGRTIALHHALLRVEHPVTHRMHTFTAPVPDAWTEVLTDAMRDTIARIIR